jgi:hypothetical protein
MTYIATVRSRFLRQIKTTAITRISNNRAPPPAAPAIKPTLVVDDDDDVELKAQVPPDEQDP